jgi:hypothetical protein
MNSSRSPASFTPGLTSASTSITRGRRRMRESRTYGAVRGAPSNGCPYRAQPIASPNSAGQLWPPRSSRHPPIDPFEQHRELRPAQHHPPSSARGHTNRPRSSRLANRHRPSPSHHSSLTRSPHSTSFSIPIAICRGGVSVASAPRSARLRLRPARACWASNPLHRGSSGSVARDPGLDVRYRRMRGHHVG